MIATRNRDLERAVAQGAFREDLLFRLNVVNLQLPALRERPAGHRGAGRALRRKTAEAERPARAAAQPGGAGRGSRQPWRGNVRELENTMHRAVLLSPSGDDRARGHPCPAPSTRATPAAGARRRSPPRAPGRPHRRRCRARPDPRHAAPLPRQPHARRQHPGHLDPHAAQQAARIWRRRADASRRRAGGAAA